MQQKFVKTTLKFIENFLLANQRTMENVLQLFFESDDPKKPSLRKDKV